MSISIRIPLALVFLALHAPGRAAAQEALVLGGGGSRGLAHGGVVVGLERLGRDPEIVVGTSMGAVVGALYAAGYEPDRIWRIIAEEDWPALFTPVPIPVGPDRDPRAPILQFGGGDRPSGLVPDRRINRRLARLLFEPQARSRGDFDRLPRRYRAVAASLRTGGRVVLGRGDLARAVRASMAVPGFFAPVRRGDEWLADGGIRDNLPVDVAHALGARNIVAVDVLRPPPSIGETDPLSIGLRGLRLLLQNATPATPPPDVLVLPAIPPEFPETLFPRDATPLLRAGLDATLAALPSGARAPPRRPLHPLPDSLAGLDILADDAAVGALARRVFADVAPARFDAAAVLAAADRLYATGLVTGVWPSVVPPPAGAPGPENATFPAAPRLRIQLEAQDRTLLAGSAAYDNDRGGRVWGSLRRRVRAGPAELGVAVSGHRLERWAVVSVLRHSPRLAPLAWSLGGHYREADVRRFANGDAVGETGVRRAGGWAGAEYAWIEPAATAAALVRAERIVDEAGADGLSWGPFLRLARVDPLTRVVGRAPRLEAEARFGAVDYRRARIGGSLDGRLGRLLLAAVGDAGLVRGAAPPDTWPALGDERLVPGLDWGEARGRTGAAGGIDVAYPVPLGGHLRLRLRAGIIDEPLEPAEPETRWLGGAELGAVWATPVGPLLVAAGAASDGGWRFDVNAGPEF